MSDEKDRDAAIELLTKEFALKGVAMSQTTDGFVALFTREYLQAMLDRLPDQKQFMIVVKRPGVN